MTLSRRTGWRSGRGKLVMLTEGGEQTRYTNCAIDKSGKWISEAWLLSWFAFFVLVFQEKRLLF